MDNRTIEEVRNNETKLIKEIEILEEENQELKKQLSNDHQIKKEFIEWLENRIVGTSRIISTEEDENNRYHALVRWTAYKEMLSKYKEIIGGNNDQ